MSGCVIAGHVGGCVSAGHAAVWLLALVLCSTPVSSHAVGNEVEETQYDNVTMTRLNRVLFPSAAACFVIFSNEYVLALV